MTTPKSNGSREASNASPVTPCPKCGASNRLELKRLGTTAVCGSCQAPLPPFAKPHAVQSKAEFDGLLAASAVPVLVDFWAGWCGPCLMAAPELERLAEHFAGRVLVLKVDTEALPDVSEAHGIRSLPSFVRFDGGKEARRSLGARPAEGIAASVDLAW